MKTLPIIAFGLFSFAGVQTADAQPDASQDAALQQIVDSAVAAALKEFAPGNLRSNQLAVTLIDLRETARPRIASHRGDASIYPASVVKLFYLAAAHQWMEDRRLEDTEELRRALRDMIVESSNDATHYVLDALTETTSGPELPEGEMKIWGGKRNAVNRYFASIGYTNINCNQKPWCEGPYGRDRVWVGQNYTNRNALTTDATARLLSSIARRRFVSGTRCDEMLALLKRDPGNQKDSQARFTFTELPAGAQLFSKAGWTSTTRHDAVCIEWPDGRRFVLVTFTTGHAGNRELIPFIAQHILRAL